jgi:Carboxypeptidase regulatory-like domain
MPRMQKFALAALICAGTCWSQVISGSLQGVVKDQQGGVVPGAAVTITQTGTGVTYSTTTNSQGAFRFDQLNIGQYRVEASKEGFKRFTTTVPVGLGNATALNIQLEVGATSQSVQVSAQAALVQSDTAEIARSFNSAKIQELPVLDRDPSKLLQLEPAVPAIVSDKNGTYDVGGLRPRSTTYNVDGSSNNYDVSSGQITPVIMDAVEELHVVTDVFSPQYGKGSGAVVDMVMRSGTNNWHGDLFEYLRNTDLNANPFFNNATAIGRSPYNENDYGATLGGPIVKNKTFFFAAFEGLNLRQAGIQRLVLPSNQYRTVDLTDAGTQASNPDVAAVIQGVFARMPSCAATTESCIYSSSQPSPGDQYMGNAKIDEYLNDNNLLSGRLLIRNYATTADTALANLNVTQTNLDYNSAITYRHIFGPSAVNEIIVTGAGYTQNVTLPTTNLPDVSISGYSGIGGSGNYPEAFTNTNYEVVDNFSWERGAHNFKFGADIMRTSTVGEADFDSRGIYAVSALPKPYGVADPLTDFRMGLTAQFVQDTGDFARRFANPDVSFYGQDDWKLLPNLTLNLGLRFEQQMRPDVTDTNTGQTAYEAFNSDTFQFAHIPNSLRGFSPFVGVAWDPTRSGKTAIRAGYRRAYDRLVLDFYDIGAILQPPFIQSLGIQLPQVAAIPLGEGPALAQNAGLPINLMLDSTNTRLPYADSWHVSIQQRLLHRGVLEVGYLGTAGRDLPFTVASNRVDPATKKRANTGFGLLELVNSVGYSNYNGLLTKFTYNLSPTVYVSASYTWSKALDVVHDAVASFGSESSLTSQANIPGTQDPELGVDYGPAVFDRPQAFSGAVVYNTPNWVHSRVGGLLLNGWNAATVILVQSGIPFSVFAGADLNQDGVNNDRPDLLDPNILGSSYDNPSEVIPRSAFNGATTPVRQGNLGRNTFRQDGIANVDLSFSKQFAVTEKTKLEFRSEFFNLFNHPEFGTPTNVLSSATFGEVLSQQNAPRQIRLGLRVRF